MGVASSQDDRYAVAEFVAFQDMRTTKTRSWLNEALLESRTTAVSIILKIQRAELGDEGVLAWARSRGMGEGSSDAQLLDTLSILESGDFEAAGLKLTLSPAAQPQIEQLLRVLEPNSKFVQLVYSRPWRLLYAPSDAWFVTSDAPVSFHPTVPATGIGTAQEIGMPLSPRCFLLMGQLGNPADETAVDLLDSDVRELNLRTMNAAHEWVYMHPDTPASSFWTDA